MASTSLSRTLGTPTNSKKFTISCWFKKSSNGSSENLFGANSDLLYFNGDALDFEPTIGRLKTNRVFKDPGAFYHVVIAADTTLATADDRLKMYVNGVQITSFASRSNPSQNADFAGYNAALLHTIAKRPTSNDLYFNGLISFFAFVDGTAYTPTSFGEVNAASGIWKPNISPSVTYGNNGFYLKMDTTSPGSDTSGNDNTFTASGTPTLAQDNVSNNLVTMNPLDNYWQGGTFSNGNNTVVTGNSSYARNSSTIGMSTGKWYSEYKVGSITGSGGIYIGITGDLATAASGNTGNSAFSYAYDSDGTKHFNGSASSFGDSYTTGDIIGVALDTTNNKLWWSKNGVWQASGDPSNNSNPAYTVVASSLTTIGAYFWSFSDNNNGEYFTCNCNFGNGFFGTTAVASSNADAAGHGLFEYAVPTGFFTLNTKNLNTYG